MTNAEYRHQRGTDKPCASEAECKAAWLELTVTERAQKLANLKAHGKRKRVWGMPIQNRGGEDFNDD